MTTNKRRPDRWLVCGSRTWTNKPLLIKTLNGYALKYGIPSILIQGGAQGADSFAAEWARGFRYSNITLFEIKPDWRTHGRAAGPIRNRRMLDMRPDIVIAFTVGASPGTADTIQEAKRRKIPTYVIESSE